MYRSLSKNFIFNIKLISLVIILSISCNLKNTHERNLDKMAGAKVQDEKSTTENQHDWIDSFPSKIKSLRDSFYHFELGRTFLCEFIDEFFFDNGRKVITNGLIPIDSTLCETLFGNVNTKQNIDINILCCAFLYSIERPFMGFYPITTINPLGVVDRPLTLILFDANGNFLNSIEVANSYGEVGGCLESSFVNDSTMIQKFRWDEYNEDNLGNGGIESSYHTQKVIFKRNGTYEIMDQ